MKHHIKCKNVWINNVVQYRNILSNVSALCHCP